MSWKPKWSSTVIRGQNDQADASRMANFDSQFGINDPSGPWANPGPLADYSSTVGPSMMPGLEQRLAGINLDKRGLDTMRGEALRTGPSRWADLMTAQQGQEEAGMRDDTRARSAGTLATARSSLAQRGGLSGGAGERLAMQGMRDTNAAQQDIGFQGANRRMQIGVQDESNRMDNLRALPGMENAALEPEFKKAGMWADLARFESDQGMRDNLAKNDYNLNRYNTRMGAWGAGQQARAIAGSGGGKGFFG